MPSNPHVQLKTKKTAKHAEVDFLAQDWKELILERENISNAKATNKAHPDSMV